MLRIRDQLYHCRSGDRTIFLDIGADRYFCLPPELDQLFLRFQETHPGKDEQDFEPLIKNAVLVPSSQSPTRIESLVPPRPTLNAIKRYGNGLSLTLTSKAVGYQLLARHKLNRTVLSEILNSMAARSRANRLREEPASIGQIWRIVAAFDRSGIILGIADQCLIRSLSMLMMLHRVGAAPYLVFGVRTNPFSAHCWIQEGDVVLNDSPEHARLFEPILAI